MTPSVTHRNRCFCELSLQWVTTDGMWGDSNTWDPATHLRDRHPDVRVVEVDLPAPLLGCVDHERRLIFIARGLAEPQRRCTITYEIGQLEQGPTPADPSLARAQQRAAEEWAALTLIPSEMFAAAWAGSLDLAAMAAYCGVDEPTFRARIRAASDADQDVCIQAIKDTRLSA